MSPMTLQPFPDPPVSVQEALRELKILAHGTQEEKDRLGDTDSMARPWDPPTCPPEMLVELWPWLDQVAAWLNHEYVWRPASLLPPCWPRHPRLARELAVLACLRVTAVQTGAPTDLEDWHRVTLPGFLQRMTDQLGEGSCRAGQHIDWPAAGRYQHFVSPQAAAQRAAAFDGTPTQLRRVAGSGR